MDHRVAFVGGLDDGGEFLPGGQDETGVPQGQFEHQRPEGLREVAHLVGGRQPGLARHMDRAQAAYLAERIPFVHFWVGQRVQGDGRVSGAARPAAQGDLLGHRARGKEGRSFLAEQFGDPLLQGLDYAAAVQVRRLVQVVQLGRLLYEGEPFPERAQEAEAGEGALRVPVRADAPFAALQDAFLVGCRLRSPPALLRLLFALFRRIAHAPDDAWRGSAGAPGFPQAFPYGTAVRQPTACGQPDAPRTDRVNMTRNRPVPGADWNGKAAVA